MALSQTLGRPRDFNTPGRGISYARSRDEVMATEEPSRLTNPVLVERQATSPVIVLNLPDKLNALHKDWIVVRDSRVARLGRSRCALRGAARRGERRCGPARTSPSSHRRADAAKPPPRRADAREPWADRRLHPSEVAMTPRALRRRRARTRDQCATSGSRSSRAVRRADQRIVRDHAYPERRLIETVGLSEARSRSCSMPRLGCPPRPRRSGWCTARGPPTQ